MKVKDNDVPKIVFSMWYGHYEFFVMPFGLTKAPVTFMDLMNHQFMVVFIDDILIYSKSEIEHEKHLIIVLHIISTEGIWVDSKKIEAVLQWKASKNFFIGLVDYYKRFVKKFSKIGLLMMKLLHKNVPFVWNNQC
ncbi:RNA-directed DNA polymerase-like protein [Gossypium australe]|uniref:RNA-directed DNA polymerase-like protein n=1 Tax=Gossypium australe TaxID=47621 RepID=A0A5B6WQW4_9ROSI|nr:RNA-directed DNA polymerase-like protein [Gossypium australe]